MSAAIKTFALQPGGSLVVAALTDGRIVEQTPSLGNTAGRFDTDWRDVPTVGLTGKISQVACRYDGGIVALTSNGFFALDRTHSGYAKAWRKLDLPPEAG